MIDTCRRSRPPRRVVAHWSALLLAVATIVAPAFSAAEEPAASDAAPPARAVERAPAADPGPATSARNIDAEKSVVPEVPKPAPDTARLPEGPSFPIVLVLPLGSETFGRAAAAVRDGFLTAMDEANGKARVIAHADGDPAAGFAEARRLGAKVIVGPLLRDDVRAIVAAASAATAADANAPLTLALNQLDEAVNLPERFYSLALAIESEGRQLARHARLAGARTIGIVGSDVPLQRRFASAFVGEWILQGGDAPVMLPFDRNDLTALRRELRRHPIDSVLLAVSGEDALRAKPFVDPLRAYSSSQVYDSPGQGAERDLDDLVFVELPWLAQPERPAWTRWPRQNFASATLERLYALGIDAYRVASRLVDGAPAALELDGVTGRLTLEASRQFAREGRLMRYLDGKAIVAEELENGAPDPVTALPRAESLPPPTR